MDGYGYKLNELSSKGKLNNTNNEIWAFDIQPYIFATGCLPMIYGYNGGPPYPCPVNFHPRGSQAWLDCKSDIEK